MDRAYQYYKEAIAGRALPLAFVDLDRFDQNVQAILERAGAMNICVASKSVRCVGLLRRIFEASKQFHAIMAFTVREAVYLAEQGFDNLLVAYPAWREVRASGLDETLRRGVHVTLMVDCHEHIEHLEAFGREARLTVPVCLDLDLSHTYPGLHFGVRRSGIRTSEQALKVWEEIRACKHVRLDGVMGYEAQVAGLPDFGGPKPKEWLIRYLKQRSIREIAERRGAVVRALRDAGADLRFVNGGGTGSVESTILEECVTEVTVGSGFYSPTLFDRYVNFKHLPAAGYAIEVTRQPTETIYTCHGGGYMASGAPGWDRVPEPYLPAGAKLLPLEGVGEVQTPISYQGPERLSLGDPVFLRHSKAGELCERFTSLAIISKGEVVDEIPTYRGDGKCFV